MASSTQSFDGESLVRPPYSFLKFTFVWAIHAVALLTVVFWVLGALTVSGRTVGLAVVWFAVSSTAITAGYHRLFAHPTYRAAWPLQLLYLIFGAAAFQGSAMQWSAQHRDHHTFVDGPKDPYNIKLGFWYAHMGWVVRETCPNYDRVPDLARNGLIRFQHRFFNLFAALTSFVLPFAIGALWQEGLSALLLAGVLRLVIQWHMTFCVNSVAHQFGSQKYSTGHTARGSWWLSFMVWGEMDHNYHHSFPNDFRTGTRWYDFDPGKWWIYLCSKIGLASDLRAIDDSRIQKAIDETEAERV